MIFSPHEVTEQTVFSSGGWRSAWDLRGRGPSGRGQTLRSRAVSWGGRGCRFESCSVWQWRKGVAEKDERIRLCLWSWREQRQLIIRTLKTLLEDRYWYRYWPYSVDKVSDTVCLSVIKLSISESYSFSLSCWTHVTLHRNYSTLFHTGVYRFYSSEKQSTDIRSV